MDDLDAFVVAKPVPTSSRPLLGLTALVVEDSRFACEAMRLLCLPAAHESDGQTACDQRAGICRSTARRW